MHIVLCLLTPIVLLALPYNHCRVHQTTYMSFFLLSTVSYILGRGSMSALGGQDDEIGHRAWGLGLIHVAR